MDSDASDIEEAAPAIAVAPKRGRKQRSEAQVAAFQAAVEKLKAKRVAARAEKEQAKAQAKARPKAVVAAPVPEPVAAPAAPAEAMSSADLLRHVERMLDERLRPAPAPAPAPAPVRARRAKAAPEPVPAIVVKQAKAGKRRTRIIVEEDASDDEEPAVPVRKAAKPAERPVFSNPLNPGGVWYDGLFGGR